MEHHQAKEMSGNKMVKIIMGTIIIASILIVIAIQTFYVLWEPKEHQPTDKEETEQPSYTKSAYDEHVLKIS